MKARATDGVMIFAFLLVWEIFNRACLLRERTFINTSFDDLAPQVTTFSILGLKFRLKNAVTD